MSISAFDIRRVTLEKNNAEAEDLNYNFKVYRGPTPAEVRS